MHSSMISLETKRLHKVRSLIKSSSFLLHVSGIRKFALPVFVLAIRLIPPRFRRLASAVQVVIISNT